MNDQNEPQTQQDIQDQLGTTSKSPFTPVFSPVVAPMKHSGLGIASFVMALISIAAIIGVTIGLIIFIINSVDLEALRNSLEVGAPAMTEEELMDQFGPMMGYIVIYPLIFVVLLIGLILGVVGLARRGYKKVFALLGTILNGLALLAVFILIVIGLVMA